MDVETYAYKIGKTLNGAYSEHALAQAKQSGYRLPTDARLEKVEFAAPPDVVRKFTRDDEYAAVVEKEQEPDDEGPLGLPEKFKNAILGTVYDIRNFDQIPGSTTERIQYIATKDGRWMYFLGLFVTAIGFFVLAANIGRLFRERLAPRQVRPNGGGSVRPAPPAVPVVNFPMIGELEKPPTRSGLLPPSQLKIL